MARLNERRDLAYNVLGQIEFMLAKAKAVDGYRATYGSEADADGIFEADWDHLVQRAVRRPRDRWADAMRTLNDEYERAVEALEEDQ